MPSAIIYDDRTPPQHYEREEHIRGTYDDYKLRRRRMQIHTHRISRSEKMKRSQQQMIADQRRIRVVKARDNMKQAVRMAKVAGKAIEYRGPLSRASIVSFSTSKLK